MIPPDPPPCRKCGLTTDYMLYPHRGRYRRTCLKCGNEEALPVEAGAAK